MENVSLYPKLKDKLIACDDSYFEEWFDFDLIIIYISYESKISEFSEIKSQKEQKFF